VVSYEMCLRSRRTAAVEQALPCQQADSCGRLPQSVTLGAERKGDETGPRSLLESRRQQARECDARKRCRRTKEGSAGPSEVARGETSARAHRIIDEREKEVKRQNGHLLSDASNEAPEKRR
jgi:hypothetical protein